jgi:hypothetical protein
VPKPDDRRPVPWVTVALATLLGVILFLNVLAAVLVGLFGYHWRMR